MTLFDRLLTVHSTDDERVRVAPTGDDAGARREDDGVHACRHRRWRAEIEGSVFETYRRFGIR